MESYKLLQRLGKGAQGSVYLSEHRDSNKKVVLKKIECNDESEANKAFREALALQSLNHTYICGYQEFFVMWDKEDSAMYVCIVMDYYPCGDLGQMLRTHRENQENIQEEELKKWLGQILEALRFVHRKKVIHRDLKPSNIFVREDRSVCIGDFGVATVMADVRTKTRTTVGSMNWMAPEVLEKEYDERSDIWSVGCIALEMATCGLCDGTQMLGKLFEIKHNDQALDEILEEVAKSYSAELVSTLRLMLTRSYNERPNSEELCEVEYIKECLTLGNSILIERRKRQQNAASQRPVPKGKGSQAVIDYLLTNLNNELCVRQGLEYLLELSKDEDGCSLDDTGKRVVVKAMKDYITEPDVQEMGCNILSNLLLSANIDDILYTAEVISVVPQAMKTNRNCAEVQQAAAAFLMAVSAEKTASELVGSLDGVTDLLVAMRSFPDNVNLCAACCSSLWSLTVCEDNARIATEEKAVIDLIDTIAKHPNSPELLEPAFALLLSLSMEDENLDVMTRRDCVGQILDAVQTHIKEAKVVKNGCMALAAIVEPEEESAYRVLTNPHPDGDVMGIPIIMRAYEQHKDNAEVVENICTLVMELVEYDEICAEVKHQKIDQKMLSEVHKRFKDNSDIMIPCEAALSKLGGGKIQLEGAPIKSKTMK